MGSDVEGTGLVGDSGRFVDVVAGLSEAMLAGRCTRLKLLGCEVVRL